VGEGAVRTALDDLRRYGQYLAANAEQKTRVDELSRPQRIVRIVELGLQSNGSCFRLDLIVDEHENALSEPRGPVAVIGEDLNEAPLRHLPDYLTERILRQPEHYRHLLGLGDDKQPVAAGRPPGPAASDPPHSGP